MRDINEFDACLGCGAATVPPISASHATEERTLFGDRVRHVDHDAHDTIVMEGDRAGSVYEVVDGAVMLYKLLQDGRRQVVELLAPGDVFGFELDGYHDSSAESLVKTRLAVVPKEAAERDHDLQIRLARRCFSQMRVLHNHAVLLGRKSAMERVASFIECLARSSGEDVIRLSMTRQEIADYLGLTIETVSRSFSELKRRGLVTCVKQDRIRIPDLDRISDLTGA